MRNPPPEIAEKVERLKERTLSKGRAAAAKSVASDKHVSKSANADVVGSRNKRRPDCSTKQSRALAGARPVVQLVTR